MATWETGISHVKVAVVVVLASGVCQNDILKFSTDFLHSLMDILLDRDPTKNNIKLFELSIFHTSIYIVCQELLFPQRSE
jgi:hypothetical protein